MAPPTATFNDGNVAYEPSSKTTASESTPKSSVLHRSLLSAPIRATHAKGNYIHLSNGQQILDASGGAAVSCLGHGNERIKKAITQQMDSGVSYCASLFYSTSAGEELADELIASTNGEMAGVFIVSSGSEAVEAALKLARQYFLELETPEPERVNFIARKESYHGTTLGALAVGSHLGRRALFEPILATNVGRVSACNRYRGMKEGESDEEYVRRLAEELDGEFQRLGPETVCAFFAEPIVGNALGCVPPVPGYFEAMRAVCDKYGALLVLDEIMSGIGRTGTMHVWQSPLVNVVPDIQTIGKGLGGGYAPVAGMLINHKVRKVLQNGTGSFSHGQTYQGHPVACKTALEVLRTIREENLVQNVVEMGAVLERLLKDKVAVLPNVGDVRGKGLFWGIEFVQDKETKEPFPVSNAVAQGVHETGMKEPYYICLYPGNGTADGKKGDHILIAPPYNVTQSDIELIVSTTASVIGNYFKRS